MNTLKITDRNKPLTERHDLETASIKEAELQGKIYNIYCPCNLNIVIDRKCNCHCDFCFFQHDTERKRLTDTDYLSGLENVLKRLSGLPIEITITGGEPTLCEQRLIPVMKLVKKYGFPDRTFSTNGSGLLRRTAGKPLLQHMKENGFIHNISLSRMSADDAENSRIFRGTPASNQDTRRIAAFAEINGMDFRLSCNLLGDSIDSWDKIKRYMEFYESYHISSFLFREITPRRKYPAISKIVEEMVQESDLRLLKTAHGMFYDVDIYSLGKKLIKHYKANPYGTQKGTDVYIKQNIITSLVYEEGELRTKW